MTGWQAVRKLMLAKESLVVVVVGWQLGMNLFEQEMTKQGQAATTGQDHTPNP